MSKCNLCEGKRLVDICPQCMNLRMDKFKSINTKVREIISTYSQLINGEPMIKLNHKPSYSREGFTDRELMTRDFCVYIESLLRQQKP